MKNRFPENDESVIGKLYVLENFKPQKLTPDTVGSVGTLRMRKFNYWALANFRDLCRIESGFINHSSLGWICYCDKNPCEF